MTEARSLAVIGGGTPAHGLPAVSGPPSPAEWTALKQQAAVIAKSGFAPKAVSTPEKVLVIAMKSRELSIPPMMGLSHVHIVEGKPTLSAELMMALVLRSGHKLRVVESTAERCVVEGVRADDPAHPSREEFTIEDARKAGVDGKDVWRKYPKAMLRARAISALCRYVFPDTLMGASYVPEELGAEVDEEGRVVEAQAVDAEPYVEAEVEIDENSDDGEDSEHAELIAEVQRRFYRFPEDRRPSEEDVIGKAEESERKARAVLVRLRALWEAEIGKRAEEIEAEAAGRAEPAGVPPEEGPIHSSASGYANDEQVEYLTVLADELYADRSDVLDGSEWLQKELGHPLDALSKAEAKNQIDSMRRQLAKAERGAE